MPGDFSVHERVGKAKYTSETVCQESRRWKDARKEYKFAGEVFVTLTQNSGT